ncbi:ArsI/CadI family heavy metal resistance metalloenzyme [Limnoglobus roseus]|uniref:Methyltransferase domain-containing protein n=1 Tax=Limnoglobus roseus TaxID=2598579 RepID=A0A5C1AS25_9BACT|nr:ArsI/CadI family heavy metal resistance metalloenzyme [Limnoglobus roseus]QEL20893.1 methyltransferase domain-containing protein [Limnoglobus roseus]
MSAVLSPVTPADVSKFHFSLWVADLGRTVAFYRVLFGREPHKSYPDYAKFEVEEPPLVLSFLPQPAPRGESLNHAGLRLPDAAGLVEVQRRLERAGYSTIREDGVECCYALQTKFWVTDPDGVRWEVYTVHQNLGHYGRTHSPVAVPASADPIGGAVDGCWTHALPDPFPVRLPFEDASLDGVTLLNTFNSAGGPAAFAHALAESARTLRPGGRLTVRGLAGDRPYPGTPDFPGLSAKYRYVPVPGEPLAAIAAAGFRDIEIETWKEACCVGDTSGVNLRTLSLTAWKTAGNDLPAVSARYEGPFARMTDDDGIVFLRGVAVPVSAGRAELLRKSAAGSAFHFAPLN